jgi:D-glycero-D-manno-heptose 1,7-bisphosphate phosphatase
MVKLVILDRDGVINQDSDLYIKSAEEWIPIDGSIDAIARLSQNGYTVALATNQSGLSRGLFDLDDLEQIHMKMSRLVEQAGGAIDGIFYCPHHPDDQCDCRKPAAGLLQAIEREWHCSVKAAPFIGDSLKDLQVARSQGCLPVLVKTGKGLETLKKIEHTKEWQDLLVFDKLSSAVDFLLGREGE